MKVLSFIFIILIFCNCVTLYHSSHILKPWSFEAGLNGNLAATGIYYRTDNINDFGGMVITTPPFSLFIRNGFPGGINTGISLGVISADIFITKLLKEETESSPQISITLDSYGVLSYCGEYGASLSINAFKHNYRENKNFNPSLTIRCGFANWEALLDYHYRGRVFNADFILGNEIHIRKNSYIMPYFGIGFFCGDLECFHGSANVSLELNLGITIFTRITRK